jgi:hypothetical protein
MLLLIREFFSAITPFYMLPLLRCRCFDAAYARRAADDDDALPLYFDDICRHSHYFAYATMLMLLILRHAVCLRRYYRLRDTPPFHAMPIAAVTLPLRAALLTRRCLRAVPPAARMLAEPASRRHR